MMILEGSTVIENEWREFDQYYDIGEKVLVNSFDICSIVSDSKWLLEKVIVEHSVMYGRSK